MTRYARIIYTALAELSCGDLVEHTSEGWAFLFDGDRMVHVLVAKVFDCWCKMAEEDWYQIQMS